MPSATGTVGTGRHPAEASPGVNSSPQRVLTRSSPAFTETATGPASRRVRVPSAGRCSAAVGWSQRSSRSARARTATATAVAASGAAEAGSCRASLSAVRT